MLQVPSRHDHQQFWLSGLVPALLLWLAFPPVGWWPLAYLVPLGWLRLIHADLWRVERPYLKLYGCGVLHWLLMTQWVRLPHWSAGFGWVVLSAYLGAYLPLWIGLSRWVLGRKGLHKQPSFLRMTQKILVPSLIWVALEGVRGYAFTGFSLALLAHSQVDQLPLLQVASMTGAYGVSFLVLLTASAVYGWLENRLHIADAETSKEDRGLRWSALAGILPCLCAILWGLGRIHGAASSLDPTVASPAPESPSPRNSAPQVDSSQGRQLQVALIQSSLDTVFDIDPQQGQARSERGFEECMLLSRQGVASRPEIDLVIWPESMFAHYGTIVHHEEDVGSPPYWTGSASIPRTAEICRQNAAACILQIGVPCLVGTETLVCHSNGMDRYNSAALWNQDGSLRDLYHKMHPVMFGEYVPLGKIFPWIYRWTPMGSGLSAGQHAVSLDVRDCSLVPSICFEDTVPHLIRRQVVAIRAQGKEPEVLVNLTNDGWFWGSSLLDLHWACAVFRAVEQSKPMLVSANTGFSGFIDWTGDVRQRGPRREPSQMIVQIAGSRRISLYSRWGDWFPILCGLTSLGIGLLSRIGRLPSNDRVGHN